METRQVTPYFHLLFPLKLIIISIFVFENSRNSFLCALLSGLFWSLKYPSFGQKLPIRTAHDTFLESRQPDVTKNPYYVKVKGISS